MDSGTQTENTPAVVAEAAPVPATPAVSDSPAAEPAAVPVESPSVPVDAPPAEAAPAPEAPAPAIDSPADVTAPDADNILGGTDVPKEEKPDGDKKTETPAPTEEAKPAEEIKLPVYEEFKLPEGYSADQESIGEFSKLLGELEAAAGKLDHKGYQEAGQKLIDLGTKNVQASIERLNEAYTQIFESSKKARLDAFKADPEMGGENFTATVSALQKAIQEYGGTPEQVAEFRKEVIDTGLDASPAVARVLFNMQKKINSLVSKYETENGGNRIVPGQKPAPSKVKPYQQFYGGN